MKCMFKFLGSFKNEEILFWIKRGLVKQMQNKICHLQSMDRFLFILNI